MTHPRSASPPRVLAAVAAMLFAATMAAPAALAAGSLYIDWSEEFFVDTLPGTTETGWIGIGSDPEPSAITDVVLDDPSGTIAMDASACIGQTVTWECQVRLTFSPVTAGGYPYTITAISETETVVANFTATSRDPYVQLWVSEEVTDFGVVGIGQTATQTVSVYNYGNRGGTVELFIQNERDQFTAAASFEVTPHDWASFDVVFTPVRVGQAATGLALTYGADTWGVNVGGMAYNMPGDDPATATPITGEGLFTDVPYTPLATSSDLEATCGITNGAWYRYAATVDTVIDFPYGLGANFPIALGEYRAGEVVSCSSGGYAPLQVMAGEELLLFIGPTDGSVGGEVYFWANVTPLAHIALTVDPRGTVTRDGALTVSGTGSSDPAVDTLLSVTAKQKSGHGYLMASSSYAIWLGQSGPWSMTLRLPAGRFVAGPVEITAEAMTMAGEAYGTHPVIIKTVRLKLTR